MKLLEDIGGFGGRKEAQKRLDDEDFIARCRCASYDELVEMMKNHSHKNTPKWKVECIRRAMARHSENHNG